MVEVRDAHPVAPADLAAIRALHTESVRQRGDPVLGEAVWRDLETGGKPGSAGVFVSDGDRLVGYAHVAPSDTFALGHWAAGMVSGDRAVGSDLLAGVVDHVRSHGGGEIVLWCLGASPVDDAAATTEGFRPSRDLLELRVGLPVPEPARVPAGVELRPFRPGVDESAWLRVNNRAFAGHPEQGGWTEATIFGREREPWFEPRGFLLAWDADELAGFCWTKVHDAEPERLGEIFVIGVDPSRQRTGLGRALTLAGLSSLSDRGIRTGMLFVDAANAPAVALYGSLGFVEHRRDRAYTRRVEPA